MKDSYRAVFFDLDGTLRIPKPNPTEAFIHFARSLGIEISSADERHVKRWAHQYWGQETLVQQDMIQFDTDTFWINYSTLLLKQVNVIENLEERANLVREYFRDGYEPTDHLVEGCQETLTGLKEKGYHIGLISNRSSPLDDAVSMLGLNGLFDFTLAAGEIDCWKPNPGIFSHALSFYDDLLPYECIYVGDNYYADGYGSAAANLYPVIFDPENLYESFDFCRIQRISLLLEWL